MTITLALNVATRAVLLAAIYVGVLYVGLYCVTQMARERRIVNHDRGPR